MKILYLKGPHKGETLDPGTLRALAAVQAGVAEPVGWEPSLYEGRARSVPPSPPIRYLSTVDPMAAARERRANEGPLPLPAHDPRALARARRAEMEAPGLPAHDPLAAARARRSSARLEAALAARPEPEESTKRRGRRSDGPRAPKKPANSDEAKSE